ncbi:unnamed protein product [Hymenolepis diminuta]|uniref:Uncharacterized protein n=1 Tax=Hymenolepis diminuta TaxID=6216 RepID=A0A564Y251_HYMDI|nr:unnamed protein product [Hymenolepis diminuta]
MSINAWRLEVIDWRLDLNYNVHRWSRCVFVWLHIDTQTDVDHYAETPTTRHD